MSEARGAHRPADTRPLHPYVFVALVAAVAVLGLIAVLVLAAGRVLAQPEELTLIGVAAGTAVVMGVAIFLAERSARRARPAPMRPDTIDEDLRRRLDELRDGVAYGRREIHELAERLVAGEALAVRPVSVRPAVAGDPVACLAHDVQTARNEAWNAMIAVANARPGTSPAQRVEVFVNLARRMQTLTHRALQGLDELENRVEDPDLLKAIFRVDHLSTRLRRQAESLAVVGGAISRRQWSRPVPVYELLRSAVSEVEHYDRVKVIPRAEGAVDGRAVADMIHLLAELLENATKFSPPSTEVLVRAEPVTAGLAIDIEDRGLGIPREDRDRLNGLLTEARPAETDELVREGRIGLVVVSALSHRHRVPVHLRTGVYGGTQAVLVIPNELVSPDGDPRPVRSPRRSREAPEPPGERAFVDAGNRGMRDDREYGMADPS